MRLQRNRGRDNHRRLLANLIATSDLSVLCTGWLKHQGLKLLLKSIRQATLNGARVIIYSNREHTEVGAIRELQKFGLSVKHFIAEEEHRYLHTKLYYFEGKGQYTAIVGSANITNGALTSNEELSVHITGIIDDPVQWQLKTYIGELNEHLREAVIPR